MASRKYCLFLTIRCSHFLLQDGNHKQYPKVAVTVLISNAANVTLWGLMRGFCSFEPVSYSPTKLDSTNPTRWSRPNTAEINVALLPVQEFYLVLVSNNAMSWYLDGGWYSGCGMMFLTMYWCQRSGGSVRFRIPIAMKRTVPLGKIIY